MTTQVKPRVGVLALTLELYETLAPGLRQKREEWLRRQILPALQEFADPIFHGAVFRRDQVEQQLRQMENDGCDGLIIVLLTYSPSQISLPALQATRLPIAIWNTQELWAVDDAFTTQKMVDNHGVHGTHDLSNVLKRCGVNYQYFTSHPQDAGATNDVKDFVAAAAAWRQLRSSRIGLLGYAFPGMGDFALDTTHLVSTLGTEVKLLTVEDYILRARSADESSVRRVVEEYRRAYELADGVTPEDLNACARVELALRGMVADHRLDGLTYQFTAFGDDERTPTTPFVGACRLMAEGVGFGGEGDVIAAAGHCLLNWLLPPATFAEMFTIDFAGNSMLLSHMGEANAAMAAGKIALLPRPPITRTQQRQMNLVVTLREGPVTLCALTQLEASRCGNWNLIATNCRVLPYGPLSGMDVPHFKIGFDRDVREFLSAYGRAGGPHHFALCFGDARNRLRQFADISGMRLVWL